MDLTRDFVRAKSPCTNGFRWFLRHYGDGGNYQELLDALVADNRAADACWLMEQFGPTDAVLVVDSIDANALVYPGTIEVRGNIDVGDVLHVG
ncbi:hypothetical protein GPA27_17845, partial [Aromatoleum toluolicum]|nr:hypothetical protein [Aromatoleum toluolicum]